MVQRKFDAVHEFIYSFSIAPESATANRLATILPIIMNDDALGDPMDYNANPNHGSWSEANQPNCFPDSTIHHLKITVDVIADTGTCNDVGYLAWRMGLIACAFPEDLDALDETSNLTLKEILELQKETTDRQCYPLFTTVDMQDGSICATNVPGLT